MDSTTKLRTYPVQLVELDDGVLIVRGSTEMQVSGTGAYGAVKYILASAARGITLAELTGKFPGPGRKAAERLVEQLVARNLLALEGDVQDRPLQPETPTDIFYWNFNMTTREAITDLNRKKLIVAGINTVSRRFCLSMTGSGLDNYEIIDDNLLRGPGLFDDNGHIKAGQWPETLKQEFRSPGWLEGVEPEEIGCIVAASDFGGQYLLRDYNKYCVEKGIFFIPVILKKTIGFVGPLVVPGETACYQCLLAREDANMANPRLQRAGDNAANIGRGVAGFHPVMSSVLGDFAAMELIKFFSIGMPWRVGELIEINLLAPELIARRVLKVPRCPVCGKMEKKPANSALHRDLFVGDESKEFFIK